MSAEAIEGAKRLAAHRAVEDHFSASFKYVGIGSGTTIVYVVEAIKAVCLKISSAEAQKEDVGDTKEGAGAAKGIKFVPTGYQSRQVIINAGLTPVAFDSLPDGVMLDVAFDGADEVDDELNCIKGGGACLFQEKLVAERAKKFVCVADYRKAQSHLLKTWPTIPIEVAPLAAPTVLLALKALGSPSPKIRGGPLDKSGPLKTDQDFFIVDAPFPTLLTKADVSSGARGSGLGEGGVWSVDAVSAAIKAITGVLEVGIFAGVDGVEAEALGLKKGGQKPVAVYFGMQDGSVTVRTKEGTK